MSEVDRVATQEAWVAVAGCQQAYDCSNEGTSDRELPASVYVWQVKVAVEIGMRAHTHKRFVFYEYQYSTVIQY